MLVHESLSIAAEEFPLPLAVLINEYIDEIHSKKTHKSVALEKFCHLTETAYRFLVFILIVEHYDALSPEVRFRVSELLERPTFARWIEMTEALPSTSALFPEIPATLRELGKYTPIDKLDIQSNLVELRNLIFHNPISEKSMERLWEKWLPTGINAIVESLMWLREVRFFAVSGGGKPVLLRGHDLEGMPPLEEKETELWISRGDNEPVQLFPFIRFAPADNLWADSLPPSVQIYNRQDATNLYYSVFGEGLLGSVPVSGVDRFSDVLFSDKKVNWGKRSKTKSASGESPYLDELDAMEERCRTIRRDMIGRTEELTSLRKASSSQNGDAVIYWIDGPPGMGKSFVTASYAADMLARPEEGELTLFYRFRGGDNYCDRQKFLEAVKLRLDKGVDSLGRPWAHTTPEDEKENRDALSQLSDRLKQIPEGKSLLLIIDGLDEICAVDAKFIDEVILKLPRRGVRLVCASRKIERLSRLFDDAATSSKSPVRNLRVFPGGLGRMSREDIRFLILHRLEGKLRWDIIRGDTEDGGNAFLETLVERSDGYPAYVNFAVYDMFFGKLHLKNFRSYLPKGLVEYQEQLLDALDVSDDQTSYRPLINALIAVARSAVTARQITAILAADKWKMMKEEHVLGAIPKIGSLLSEKLLYGKICYEPYSQGLREQIVGGKGREQNVFIAREALAGLTEKNAGHALTYYFRHGIAHILEMAREYASKSFVDPDALRRRAMALLTDFPYLMRRLRALGGGHADVVDLLNDYDAVEQAFAAAGTVLSREEAIWFRFMKMNAHLLKRADEEWPAYKILLQLACEHAENSPLTRAADAWLAETPCPCDWEWLRNRVMPSGDGMTPCDVVLEGHTRRIDGALLFADETRILSWSLDGTLMLWNIGGDSQKLTGHSGEVQGALLLPDEKAALSWSVDNTLILWDLELGSLRRVLGKHTEWIAGALLLPGGKAAVSWGDDEYLHLWRFDGGKEIVRGHSDIVTGATLLPDGKSLLSWAKDGELILWETDSDGNCEMIRRFACGAEVKGAAASPDASRIVAWASDGTLQAWKTSGGDGVIMKGHDWGVLGVVFVPERNAVLSWSDDKTIRLWNLETGSPLSPPFQHLDNTKDPGVVEGILVLADGATVISWGHRTGEVFVWQLPSEPNGEVLRIGTLSGHGRYVRRVKLFADGQRLLTIGEDKDMRVWDIAGQTCLHTFEGHWARIEGEAIFAGDQRILSWSGDASLRLWDFQFAASEKTSRGHMGRVMRVQLLPDGKRLIAYGLEISLLIWNLATGKDETILSGHKFWPFGFKLFDEDRKLVTWSRDGTLRLWDLSTGGSTVLSGHKEKKLVYGATFLNGEERILSWSEDATARIWNLKTLSSLSLPHDGFIYGATGFDHDAKVLTWSEDSLLRSWNSEDGALLHTFRGHDGAVLGAHILPCGRRAISWSDNGDVLRWELGSGEESGRLAGDGNPAVWVTPLEGDAVLVCRADSDAFIGDIATGQAMHVLSGFQPVFNSCLTFRPEGSSRGLRFTSFDTSKDPHDSGVRYIKGYSGWLLASPECDGERLLLGTAGDGIIRAWKVDQSGIREAESIVLRKKTLSLVVSCENGDAFEFSPGGVRNIGASGASSWGVPDQSAWSALSQFFFSERTTQPRFIERQWHCSGANDNTFRHHFSMDDCMITSNGASLRMLAYMRGGEQSDVAGFLDGRK